jgi:hypothetical protein
MVRPLGKFTAAVNGNQLYLGSDISGNFDFLISVETFADKI